MATNIPPHNLGEIIEATIALIENPAVEDVALLDMDPGPDFPTGGQIIGRAGSRNGLLTGRGSVIMRAKTDIETVKGGREAIIVSEVPFQVNKAAMVGRSPSWCVTRRSKASPTCATRAIAPASAW
jgi:DNA gyrase subunit A